MFEFKSISQFERGVVKEPTPSGPGPWGGQGGKPWDDGVYSGIKQIFVTRGNDAISSLQVEYDRNGQSVWSVKHGGNNGVFTHRVNNKSFIYKIFILFDASQPC